MSTLALISNDSLATCQTSSTGPGTDYGNTSVGVGLHPTVSPPPLSYVTRQDTNGRTSVLVGRVPPATTGVRVVLADGFDQPAVIGGGLWLAWLDEPSTATPVAIEALDASGTVVSRMANTEGLQPTD